MEPILTARGLTKRYGKVTALDNCDFDLMPGEILAVIGDNGVIAYRIQEHKQLKTVSDPNFPKEYFGIVVKQGNKVLLDKLNAGLAAIKADGSYAKIYKTWFQAEAPELPAK